MNDASSVDHRFALYDPSAHRGSAPGCEIRDARVGDEYEIAELSACRSGGEPEAVAALIRRDLEAAALGETRSLYVVAVCEERIVAYGRASASTPSDREGARNVPNGWYLTGVIVQPNFRRRGIGEAVTIARIQRIAKLGASRVYYLVNDANRASIAMHDGLGFIPRTHDFDFPGMQFTGGNGVLYELAIAEV